jgi:hypothetical protein
MSMLERAYRRCVWCKKDLGCTLSEYCSPACKQKAYRYRKRGNKEARRYRRIHLFPTAEQAERQ